MKKLAWQKRLRIWISLNMTLFVALIGIVVLLVVTAVSLSSLDSYPRTQLLAGTPISLFKQVISVFLWVFIILKFLQGGGTDIFKKDALKSENVNVRFDDVVGAEEAKQEAKDLVAMLKGDATLQGLGARSLKGILMIGPPGCGKTFLAKAIATEADIPFLAVSGSEMTDMFVGVGASKIRHLFQKARLLAKELGACIIFIDEIDVIGKRRQFQSSDQETNKTLNQLLVEMDGVVKKSANITVIAATNAPEHRLDPALLRAGRFDRKLYYDLPRREERIDLFEHFLKPYEWDRQQIQLPFWAGITSYHSPADIENIVEEAHLISLRKEHALIQVDDLSEAIERIQLGLRRRIKVPDFERERTAYHEAGHLVAIQYLSSESSYFKISIVMRKQTLGVVHSYAIEESFLRDRSDFLGSIAVNMGGYAAEKIKYGSTTGGVISDFRKATGLAYSMVYRHGMGASGHIGNYDNGDGLSEKLKWVLNEDVETILREGLRSVEKTLTKHWKLIETIVQELMEREQLELLEIKEIIDAYEGQG